MSSLIPTLFRDLLRSGMRLAAHKDAHRSIARAGLVDLFDFGQGDDSASEGGTALAALEGRWWRLLDRAEAELLCEEIARRAPGALAPDGISEHLLADLPPMKLRGMLLDEAPQAKERRGKAPCRPRHWGDGARVAVARGETGTEEEVAGTAAAEAAAAAAARCR